jgi:hypothetical protein
MRLGINHKAGQFRTTALLNPHIIVGYATTRVVFPKQMTLSGVGIPVLRLGGICLHYFPNDPRHAKPG